MPSTRYEKRAEATEKTRPESARPEEQQESEGERANE